MVVGRAGGQRGNGSGAQWMIILIISKYWGSGGQGAWRRKAIEHKASSEHGASTIPTCGAPPPTIYHKVKVAGRLGSQGAAAQLGG